MDLNGEIALVTGGAVRVGAAIVRALARAGCDVVVHCHRSTGAAEAVAGEIRGLGRRASVIRSDLRSAEAAEKVAEDAEKAFGKIDILVNSAAVFFPTPTGTVTEAQWRDLVDLNLKAAYFLSDRLGGAMKKRGNGAIVNIADAGGIVAWPSYGVYCIAKAGLIMMTRVQAKALSPQVRVNAVAPGPVLLPEGTTPEESSRAAGATLLGRIGSPEDVANAVVFLARDADYMTGQVLAVDGGRTAL